MATGLTREKGGVGLIPSGRRGRGSREVLPKVRSWLSGPYGQSDTGGIGCRENVDGARLPGIV